MYCASAPPLPDELIRMQFRAQLSGYASQHPGTSYQLVLLDDRSVGKLWVDRREGKCFLVDIAMLPEYRKRGIGTALIRELQAEGLPIRSTVFRFNNGSLLWHQRLGFQVASEDEVSFHMEWLPYGTAL